MSFITLQTQMVAISCCSCGTTFGMSKGTYNTFTENKKTFFCPYGHQQHFTGKSDAQLLEDERRAKAMLESQLKAAKDSRDYYEQKNEDHKNALRATKGVVTKMKKRSAAGMCQCCNRSFKNIHDHYKTKHPQYKDQ